MTWSPNIFSTFSKQQMGDQLLRSPTWAEEVANRLYWALILSTDQRMYQSLVADLDLLVNHLSKAGDNQIQPAYAACQASVQFISDVKPVRRKLKKSEKFDLASIVERIITDNFLSGHHRVDATGALEFVSTCGLDSGIVEIVQQELACQMASGNAVPKGSLLDFTHLYTVRLSTVRRRLIWKRFLGQPCTYQGFNELRRFVAAVMNIPMPVPGINTTFDMYTVCFQHWFWNLKRKVLGQPFDDPMMIVLSGPQGKGKTKALEQLLSPIEELVLCPMQLSHLIDERASNILRDYPVGVIEELAGAGKAENEAVKARLTAKKVFNRVLTTHLIDRKPNRMCFLGTSNASVVSMLRDESGHRRFLDIPVDDRADWAVINSINYDLILANCVDERLDTPLCGPIKETLRDYQASLEEPDSFEVFLRELYWPDIHLLSQGIPSDQLYHQFISHLADHKESTYYVTLSFIGKRLRQLGWKVVRPAAAAGQQRARLYVPPAEYLEYHYSLQQERVRAMQNSIPQQMYRPV